MGMFWEFFTFELRFRIKSISTYIYFLLWKAFSFFRIASENFGPIANSNGKVLLNGPYANTLNDAAAVHGLVAAAYPHRDERDSFLGHCRAAGRFRDQ